MKKRASFLLVKILAIFGLFVSLAGMLFACGISDGKDIFTLETDKTENVLVYKQEFDFNEYFSDSYIKKTTESGEEFIINLTEEMFVNGIDTESVGEKTAIVKVESKLIEFHYTVKYEVKFLVEGNVYGSQLALNITELDLTEPTKEGFTFSGWQGLPSELNDNVVLEGYFTKNLVAPALQELEATYGDKLESLTLPSNEFGSWQFTNSNATVGDLGENQISVKFVLKDGTIYKEDYVTIKVSKKALNFTNVITEFIYDGTAKFPIYDFSEQNVTPDNVSAVCLIYRNGKVTTAIEAGEYEYKLVINDKNYQGELEGTFTIAKKQVTAKISNAEMTYGDALPEISISIVDDSGKEVSQPLQQEINAVVNFTNLFPDAGEYTLSLVEKDYANFIVLAENGTLKVNKATLNTAPIISQDSKAVYGEKLSSVSLLGSTDGLGEWEWLNGEEIIPAPGVFVARAKFIPNDTKNYNEIEEDVTLTAEKRVAEIIVIKNEFTYNGEKHALSYSVNGILPEDAMENYEITGSEEHIDAGEYVIILSLKSEKYQAKKTERLIIKQASLADFDAVEEDIKPITYNKQTASKIGHVSLPKNYAWKDASSDLLIGTHSYEIVYTPDDFANVKEEETKISVTVLRAESKIDAQDKTFTFNEENKYDFTASLNHLETKLVFEYFYNQEKVDGLKNAGEYKVTITAQESEHYSSASKTVNVVITPVPNTDTLPTCINATYLDTLDMYLNELPENWQWQDASAVVGNFGEQIHMAVFVPSDTLNYLARTEQIIFNVSKKLVDVPSINLEGHVYNGELYKPEVLASEVYTIVNEGGVDADNYEVKLTLNDTLNYAWQDGETEPKTFTYVIEKQVVAVPKAPSSRVFTGEPLTADIETSELYTTVNEGGVDADNYDVILKLVDKDNYKWSTTDSSEDITLIFEITKSSANKWITPPSMSGWTYGGAKAEPSSDSIYGDVIVTYQGVDGTIYGEEKPTNAGNYKAIFTVEETENYNGLSEPVEFTIEKATNEFTSDPGLSKTTWIYGEDSASVTIAEAKFGKLVVKYTDETNEYNVMPTNAGNYKAIFTVEETENYNGLSATVEFTIDKKSVSEPKATTTTYDGLEKTFVSATNEYTVSNGVRTNAGKYNVVLSLNNKVNYKWSTANSSEDITLEFTIEKQVVTVPNAPGDKVFTGATLTADIVAGDLYEVSENEGGVEVGEYDVILTLKDTLNYKWKDSNEASVTIKFRIVGTKENAWLKRPSISGWIYGGAKAEPSYESRYGDVIVTYQGVDGTIYGEEQPTNAGNYKAIFTVEETENYNGLSATVEFTIEKRENAWLEGVDGIEDSETITYLDKLEVKSKYGQVVVSAVGIEGTEYNSSEMPSEVGVYTITLTVSESLNDKGLEKTFKLTIEKFALEINKTNLSDDEIYENSINSTNIEELIKPELNAEAPGTFTYTIVPAQKIDADGCITVVVGFNLEDTKNFSTPLRVNAKLKVKKVARIGTNYYGTIEGALSRAQSGDTVFVTVGETGIVIKEDCTVKSGVSLILPYDETEAGPVYNTKNSDGTYEATLNKDSLDGDNNNYKPFGYLSLKLRVTIASSVVLTVNGTLMVAGELSGGNGGYIYAGQTAGKYAEIMMEENAQIVINNAGNLDCCGFIHESSLSNGSKVDIKDGGTIGMPFVVLDHRGGSFMSAVWKKSSDYKISPFNQYEFRNVTSQLTVYYGGTLYGYANMYASSKHNASKVALIGITNSSLIQLNSEDSKVVGKYNTTVENYTAGETSAYSELHVYGGAVVNALSMELAGVAIKTNEVYFPIPWTFHIGLHSGNYTMSALYKIMTGAELIIAEDATLTAGSIVVYEKFEDTCATTPKYPSKAPGKLVVNGKLIIENLAGKVYATGSGGQIIVNSSVAINSYEAVAISGSSFLASLSEKKEISETFELCYGSAFTLEGTIGTTYYSYDNGNGTGGWTTNAFGILFNSNGGSSVNNLTIMTETYTIQAADLPVPTRDHYDFAGWFIDASLTTSAIGQAITEETILYAKWTATTYTLEYKDVLPDGSIEDSSISGTPFTIETPSLNLFTPSAPYDGYTFMGWYTEPVDGIKITELNVADLVEQAKANGKTVSIYAVWLKLSSYTITYVNGNNALIETDASETIYVDGEGNVFTSDGKSAYLLPITGSDGTLLTSFNNDTEKEYYFNGWYLDADFTTPCQDVEDIKALINNGSDIKLYASWLQKNKLTFDAGDSGNTGILSTTIYLMPDQIYTLPTIGNYEYNTAYSRYFNDYTIGANATNNNGVVTITADATITANWIVKYSVTGTTISNSTVKISATGYSEIECKANTSYWYKDQTALTFAVTFSQDNSKSFSFTAGANGSLDANGSISATINKSNITFTSSSKSSGCLVAGTLITLADGSTKKLEDLTTSDLLLTYNHITGQYEAQPLLVNVHGLDTQVKEYDVVYLYFSDGSLLGIVEQHGVFDLTLNRYVYITAENVFEYIGHEFTSCEIINGKATTRSVILTDVKIKCETIAIYSPVSMGLGNVIANNKLTFTPDTVNMFEYGESMIYDQEKMQADIEKYGLYTYEDFKDYLSEEVFNACFIKYYKVAVGKGLYTYEKILWLLSFYNDVDSIK